ncbi:MAG: A24 family peptidase [Planctomycetota bacterium]|nr:A24 family peptidase [Planctomycetota bacterium]
MLELREISTVALVAVGACTLIAAVTDLWKFKVYNALTFPLMATGLLYHVVMDGWSGFTFASLGLICGFATLAVFFAAGGVGAGDVKLMAGIGAWIGTANVLSVFLASALLMGVWVVVAGLINGRLLESIIRAQIEVARMRSGEAFQATDETEVENTATQPDRRKRLIPFAAAAAMGLLATTMLGRI